MARFVDAKRIIGVFACLGTAAGGALMVRHAAVLRMHAKMPLIAVTLAIVLMIAVLVAPHSFVMSEVQASIPYIEALMLLSLLVLLRVRRDDYLVIVSLASAYVAVTVLMDAAGYYPGVGLRRPGGVLHNRNFAGEFLSLALPCCVIGATTRRLMVLPLVGAALFVTRCRTAWVAAILCLAVVFMLGHGRQRWKRGMAAMLVLTGALSVMIVPFRLKWAERAPYYATARRLVDFSTGSGHLRWKQYAETIHLMQGHWLRGLGAGEWQRYMFARDAALAHNSTPHSDYLRALSDGGVFALVGLVGLFVAASLMAWRHRGTAPEVLGGVLAASVISIADVPLLRPESLVLVTLYIGTLIGKSQ